jgi:hypothetical protein
MTRKTRHLSISRLPIRLCGSPPQRLSLPRKGFPPRRSDHRGGACDKRESVHVLKITPACQTRWNRRASGPTPVAPGGSCASRLSLAAGISTDLARARVMALAVSARPREANHGFEDRCR